MGDAELMLLMGVGLLGLMFACLGTGDQLSRTQKFTIRGGVSPSRGGSAGAPSVRTDSSEPKELATDP